MVKNKPAAELVLDELLRGVDSGDYLPGQRVNAASLGKKLGLSLAPVREALHVLAGQGVVELLPKRGAVLREMRNEDLRDYWSVLLALGRLGIELATVKAAEPDNAKRLRQEQAHLHRRLLEVNGSAFYKVTNRVHYLLNEIADNRFLHDLTSRYMILYWEKFLSEQLPYEDYRQDYIANYDQIIESVLRGDSRTAVAAWEYHVRWSVALIEGVNAPRPGQPWIG